MTATTRRTLALVAATWLAAAAGLSGQSADRFDPRRAGLTRAELEQLLTDLDQTAESPVYSSALRARARSEAGLIRQRLQTGDFRTGDRILLTVEQDATLSDTFTVEPGPILNLPVIGAVQLGGLLRAELEAALTQQISRFVREPTVHTQSLMRLSIVGQVGQPGFYTVPTNLVVTDALMVAGGPAGLADLRKIRIERGNDRIWDGEAMQQAITDGRTLDEMYLQAGDRIYVPQQRPSAVYPTLRNLSLAIGLIVGIYGLTQIF